MTNEITRVVELDDPTKPHRSVWRTPTGLYVKLHVTRRDGGLGKLSVEIRPSACDSAGRALRRADDEVAFLTTSRSVAKQFVHLVQAVPDRVEDVEPFPARLHREMMWVVLKTERAMLDEAALAAL